MKQLKDSGWGAKSRAAACSSAAAFENGAVVLGRGKPIFQNSVATQNMFSMLPKAEHDSPTQNVAIASLFLCCLQ
jgi:hypothetical protein